MLEEIRFLCFLHEFLKEFGFSVDNIKKIYASLDSESGKIFYSQQYKLIKDRKELLIYKNKIIENEEFFVNFNDNFISVGDMNLKITYCNRGKDFKIKKSSNFAFLDADKLKFPLKLRHWQKGDYFYPLGMKGKKKLSDFFNDMKINIIQKERIWLLTSGKEIVWVVNYRINDKFKITDKTKKILIIEVL